MNNVLVVYKKSKFELYSNSPDKPARDFALISRHAEKLQRLDDENRKTLETVVDVLAHEGISHNVLYRAKLSNLGNLDGNDLVIAVGGDGTFLEVSHYVAKAPILGVNSNPGASFGFFSAANRSNFAEVLRNIEKEKRTRVERMQVYIDGKPLPEPVLNDALVTDINPAATARSIVISGEGNGNERYVGGSGVLACTAAGSTAWWSEIGGKVMPLTLREIQYKARDQLFEKFYIGNAVELESMTRQGKVYLDGEHLSYDFTLGSIIRLEGGKAAPLENVIGDLQAKQNEFVRERAAKLAVNVELLMLPDVIKQHVYSSALAPV